MSYMTEHPHISQSRTIAVSLRGASFGHLPPVATQFKRLISSSSAPTCRYQRAEELSFQHRRASSPIEIQSSKRTRAVFGPHPRLPSSLGCLSLRPAPPIGLDASNVLLAFILVSTCFSPPTLGPVAPHAK